MRACHTGICQNKGGDGPQYFAPFWRRRGQSCALAWEMPERFDCSATDSQADPL